MRSYYSVIYVTFCHAFLAKLKACLNVTVIHQRPMPRWQSDTKLFPANFSLRQRLLITKVLISWWHDVETFILLLLRWNFKSKSGNTWKASLQVSVQNPLFLASKKQFMKLDYFVLANFCMCWGVMQRFKQISNVSQCCQTRNFSLVKRYNMTFKNTGQLFYFLIHGIIQIISWDF